VSAATGRRYPVAMICVGWRVPRATLYGQRKRLADETALNGDALGASQSGDRPVGDMARIRRVFTFEYVASYPDRS